MKRSMRALLSNTILVYNYVFKMKPAKFIALVICALVAALSIPHVTLWGFSVGSGVGFAADMITITPNPTSPKTGDSLELLSDAMLQSGSIKSHTIVWGAYKADGTLLKRDAQTCTASSSTRCETTFVIVEIEPGWAGAEIRYFSEVIKQDNTKISDPTSGYKKVGITSGGTPPAPTPTPSGSVQITSVAIEPQQPKVNEQVTFNFNVADDPNVASLRVLARIGSSTRTINVQWRVFGCPPACSGSFTPSQAGDYDYDIAAVGRSNNILGQISGSFSVSAATPTPSANQCCVEFSGNMYKYVSGKSSGECRSDAATTRQHFSNSCSDAQRTVCSDVCRSKGYGSGGACTITGGQYDSTRTFNDVCDNQVPCVCSGQRQYNPQDMDCNDACLSGDPYYSPYGGGYTAGYYSPLGSQSVSVIPFGTCTSNPRAFQIAQATISQSGVQGTSVASRPARQLPGPPGSYRCPADEFCVCTYVDLSSFTANKRTPVTSLPGTQRTPSWVPPDAIANPPTAQPNEHDCSAAVNATITASFSGTTASGTSVTKLFSAGDIVTITGKVERLSDTCKGYKYTCRTLQELGCEVKTGCWGFCKNLDYQACPANLPEQVHADGKGKSVNWRLIGGLGLIAAGIFTPCGTVCIKGGISVATGAVIDSTQCGTPNEGVGQGAALAMYGIMSQAGKGQSGGSGGTTTSPGGAQQPTPTPTPTQPSQPWYNPPGPNTPRAAATSKPTFDITGEAVAVKSGSSGATDAYAAGATYGANLLPACPSQQRVQECFSVCGKTYETPVAPAPTCVGPVIKVEEATYTCGLGSCGPFANRKVKIEIRDPNGAPVITDETTTDANGDFSYTFQAPAGDGEFSAIISVPKD